MPKYFYFDKTCRQLQLTRGLALHMAQGRSQLEILRRQQKLRSPSTKVGPSRHRQATVRGAVRFHKAKKIKLHEFFLDFLSENFTLELSI